MLRFLLRLSALILLAWASLAAAHEGHDHTPPPAQTAQTPRFAAQSELFELVGVIENGALQLFLDRFADNSPLPQARIEVELGESKLLATAQADGSYRVQSPAFARPGNLALTFTISAGDESDLLAANLELPADKTASAARRVPGWLPWAAILLLGGLIMLWLWRTGERS